MGFSVRGMPRFVLSVRAGADPRVSLLRPARRSPGAAVFALLACLAVALPATASAASLGLDQRCYVAGETASVSGSGFAAGAPVGLTLAEAALPQAKSDASGSIRAKFAVPAVAFGLVESQVEIGASDGSTQARAMLNIVNAGASFEPTTGDPRTMRVRHVVSGLGLSATRPSVYLHYVSPSARKAERARGARSSQRRGAAARVQTKQTTNKPAAPKTTSKPSGGGSAGLPPNPPGVRSIRVGLLRGPCGVLRTSPRKLFPFKPAAGRWELQYDTNPRYVRGTSTSAYYWVRKVVTVKN